MKEFAAFINTLDSTNKTTQKLEAVRYFLEVASDKDKLWFLALFTGKRPKRAVSTTLMRQWVLEIIGLPEWLFLEAYSSVGDLGETISLVLPESVDKIELTLSEWMDRIIDLKSKTDEEKKEFVIQAWQRLPHQERFIFNKLLGGSFRVGVSSKGLINALSSYYEMDPSAVSHSIMGEWNVDSVTFDKLIQGDYIDTNLSKPYPFCLAYPLEKSIEEFEDLKKWQIEYKWDGIRAQLIKRNNELFIWSRGEELVTDQFPEIVEAFKNWEDDFVLDGEILGYRDNTVLNFNHLQKRLNRKVLSKQILAEVPVTLFVYDLLEWQSFDYRSKQLHERRELLESLFKKENPSTVFLSEIINFNTLAELARIRENARDKLSEGLMLKRKDSIYHTGRKKGDWWKWKIDPLTIDAVLIYAQKGSGRRSAYYTDYTFAVRDGDSLVSIAKAYSGLTDAEIKEVSKFINKNAIEKFGPVRTVKPELVFEIAFEGIGFSNRHKSGVALRFPRILRWRKDKAVNDIDNLDDVKRLII